VSQLPVLPSSYELLICSGEESHIFQLPLAGEVSIGRDEGSGLRIDDPSVSRQHAILRVGETLEIEDLGGPNGIFVRHKAPPGAESDTLNVQRLKRRRAPLSVGDCLLFGTARVVVRRHSLLETQAPLSEELMDAGSAGLVEVRDPVMRALYVQAARAARANISVLLLGETGVGKEVLARAIHAQSPRAKQPFMGINCAALAESLIENELFGSEKGAFTGAVQAREGLFEAANGGTVFLDEIGELPLGTQAKLLRVIEERVVMRLGSNRTRSIDVRFLAATNRDLERTSRAGRFREDLYFRLAGISLTIPPLRERAGELELLVTKFVAAAARQVDRATPPIVSSRALELLRVHAWPGNVRELRNVVERAVVLCEGDTIDVEHLPHSLVPRSRTVAASESLRHLERQPEAAMLPGQIKALERARIVDALERCAGNQSQAAKALGISRSTLIARVQEFGLRRPRGQS